MQDWQNILDYGFYPLKLVFYQKEYYEVPFSDHIQNILVRDVRKKLPFNDEFIDFIYSLHLLEHLRKDEAEMVLIDCFRILKRGAFIRLVVLDLELMARNYIKEIGNIQNNKVYKKALMLCEEQKKEFMFDWREKTINMLEEVIR